MSGLDFYNDNDPAACAWIEQLIAAGLIPPGRVDNRSIADVRATDLSGLRRAHFFAGIGGWAEALRLADFPDWLPVWTGSPPCQPFSAAGKRAGRDDARHLGPAFVDLVRAGRPPVLFGEQVASSDAIGRAAKPRQQGAGAEPAWAWWDDLSLRLEAAGYAAWSAVVPAAGVGAPHIRERLFFCAVDLRFAAGGVENAELPAGERQRRDGGQDLWQQEAARLAGGCLADGLVGNPGADAGMLSRGLAIADHQRRDRVDALLQWRGQEQAGSETAGSGSAGGMAHADGRDARAERQQPGGQHGQQPRDGGAGGLGNAINPARQRDAGIVPAPQAGEHGARLTVDGHLPVGPEHAGSGMGERSRPTNGFWGTADWLLCRDERWRPVEPGTFPLAHGVPGRVGLLRGYGNAIVPQAAAEFIAASREVLIETGIWDALRRAHALREAAA